MISTFNLWRPINPRMSMNEIDLRNTERALRFLGHYKDPNSASAQAFEASVVDGLKRFQRQHGLASDGVMNPDGPTHQRLREVLNASTGEAASQRAPIVGGEHDGMDRISRIDRTTLLGSRRGRGAGAPSMESSRKRSAMIVPGLSSNAKLKQPGNDDAPTSGDETSTEIALAAPAARFFIWLMERYGLPTIAAAIAIYNSWNKERQEAVKREYDDDDAQYDRCEERYKLEIGRCAQVPKIHQNGCRERAKIRKDMCYRRIPIGDQPPEWSEDDMLFTPSKSPEGYRRRDNK